MGPPGTSGSKARRLYAIHRWLGALIGLQLVLWAAGGVVFSTHAIAWVRGERGMKKEAPRPLALERIKVSAQDAVRLAGGGATRIELRALLDHPIYEVRTASSVKLVDAETGEVRPSIDRETAIALAKADRADAPAAGPVELIVRDPPTEYRGQPLPVWRVALFDADRTALYVDAATGAIRARRNDAWRRFDFFWMLHTMDYRGRDDFNHPLLIGFSLLGLVTVLSGWVVWGVRASRAWRRRRAAAV